MMHHITYHSGTHICNSIVHDFFTTSKFTCIGMDPPYKYLDSPDKTKHYQWISHDWHERPFEWPGTVSSALYLDDPRVSVVWGLRHPLTRMLGNKRWQSAVDEAITCGKKTRGKCAQNQTDARQKLLSDWSIPPRGGWWDNYGLRWITGYGSKQPKPSSPLEARLMAEEKARAIEVGMLRLMAGEVVMLSEWLPQSICVLCKVFRMDRAKCRAKIRAEQKEQRGSKVSTHLSVKKLLAPLDNETATAIISLNMPEIELYWFGVQLAFRQFEHYNCSAGSPEEI